MNHIPCYLVDSLRAKPRQLGTSLGHREVVPCGRGDQVAAAPRSAWWMGRFSGDEYEAGQRAGEA